MITKKLAVPLINDKILQQAEHCYIATSSISDAGFEFIRSRINPKCKVDIVTGLDVPTSPVVLERILRNYQGRINLQLFTKNTLNANLYIFDLPFRKSVAFVGSGALTMEGLKDHEELFWKITDAKEIESLMSWYTSYFQFSVPLSEEIVRDYAFLYPEIQRRVIRSRMEKNELFRLTAPSFNWDGIKFRNQFFKREDFAVLANANAGFDNASLRLSRMALGEKLLAFYNSLATELRALKFIMDESGMSPDPRDHRENRISAMWLRFVREGSKTVWIFQFGISQRDIIIRAISPGGKSDTDRLHQLQIPDEAAARADRFKKILATFKGYDIEIAGVSKAIDGFSQESQFIEHIKTDQGNLVDLVLQRRFAPGDAAVSVDSISKTVTEELTRLVQFLEA